MPENIEIGKLATNMRYDQLSNVMFNMLVAAMSKVAEERGIDDFIRVPEFSKLPKEPLVVSMTINGVEVSLKDVMEHWEESREAYIRDAAHQLVNEKLGTLVDDFAAMQTQVMDAFTKDLSNKLGIELEDRDR